MDDMAATSLSGRIGRMGGRFITEIAASSIATLCVSLALSSYFSRESPASPAYPTSPPAFTRAYAQIATIGGQIGATAAALSDWQSVAPASARGVDLALAPAAQAGPPQPAAPASRSQPHQSRPRAHTARPPCSGDCAGHTLLAARAQPLPVQATVEPQPVLIAMPRASFPSLEYAAETLMPPLPIPEGAFARSGPHPIARVANLLTNLVGR